MSFDLELYFTGLCLFTFDPPSPASATRCDVLLVNALNDENSQPQSLRDERLGYQGLLEHKPRLAVSVKNLDPDGSWRPDHVVPQPDGEDLAVFDLAKADMRLEADSGRKLRVKTGWDRRRRPRYSSTERWFEWTVHVPGLDSWIEKLGDPAPGAKKPIISRLRFDTGDLSCFELGRRHGEWLDFEFKTVGGQDPPRARDIVSPRCITDRLVLRFGRLQSAVRITWGERSILIGQEDAEAEKRETVLASMTNMPDHYHHLDKKVYDFLWYYTAFEWTQKPDPADLVIPTVSGPYSALDLEMMTPSSGLCPPGGG